MTSDLITMTTAIVPMIIVISTMFPLTTPAAFTPVKMARDHYHKRPYYRSYPHMRCRLSDVQNCLMPLQGYAHEMEGVFKPLNDHPIDETCQDLIKVKECLAPIQPYCSGIVRRVFEGMIDGMDYLCQPAALQIYKNHESCLGKTEVQAASRNCSDIYSVEIKNISPINKTTSQFYSAICHGVHDYLGCIKNDVKAFCGEEAGEWQYMMGLHFLRPVMEEVECSVEGPQKVCSGETVNKCLEPLQAINQRMQNAALDNLLPEVMDHNETCQLLTNVTTCLDPIQAYCDMQIRKTFEGLMAGLAYVCNEASREVFNRHGACLQSPALMKSAGHCTQYMNQLQGPDFIGSSIENMYDQMCIALRDVLWCMWGEVNGTCGEEAADWHQKMSLSFLSPILHSIDCVLDPEESDAEPNTGVQPGRRRRLGVAIGLCALIMVVAGLILGVLLYRRFRGIGRPPTSYSPSVFEVDSSVSYKPLHEEK